MTLKQPDHICTGAPDCGETECGHFKPHKYNEIDEIDCRGGVCLTMDNRVYCKEVEDGI